jgi:AraC family transcriptional activator of pobA
MIWHSNCLILSALNHFEMNPNEIIFGIYTLTGYQHLQYNKPSRSAGFEILWIRKGAGSLIVDGVSTRLEEHAVYFLMPGRVRVLDWHGDTDVCIIHFSPQFLTAPDNRSLFFSDFYGDFIKLAALAVDEDTLGEMQELIIKMKKEFHQYSVTRPAILQNLLNLYLIYFSANIVIPSPEMVSNHNRVLVNKFLCLVKDSYKRNKFVSDYASRLHVTPNYLNEVVKKVSGSSARHHIKQCILTEAKNLALYSGLSMKEIAANLGFEDPCHFSKFFKNSLGINFSSFKKARWSICLKSPVNSQPLATPIRK